MLTACDMIRLAGEDELNDIIMTVMQQYSFVHPDWALGVYVIQKNKDISSQIDHIIAFLEGVKKIPPTQEKGG